MTPHDIDLGGSDWKLLPMMPREWEWKRVWEAPQAVYPTLWIQAQVPGTVQDDAAEAGLIPDFTHDFNSRACEWTSERDWVYLREFPTPDLFPGAVVRLCFEGVDYACHVFLNGRHLGDHEGMYDRFEFDVTEAVAASGLNQLVVVVEHAPREVGQIGRTSQVRLWKARFAYDWDWCTRLVPVGIYDRVRLSLTGPAYVKDVQVHTHLDADLRQAAVGVEAFVGAARLTSLSVRTVLSLQGERLAEHENPLLATGDRTGSAARFVLPEPQLWWPNGYGDQPLYQATVTLAGDDGSVLDERTVSFGLRRVCAVANDEAPPDALPYVLEVNGQRVFIKGWNWAPIHQLYGRERPGRYERWLRLARNAHCNLLRVWGGGLLEKECFYDLCDRLGIMVWQEFIQSSSGIDNRPSTDPHYLAYIKDQAEKMIPRRRNHPSLVLWCGGNELMHDDWRPLDDTHPALAVLKDCVRRLDPDRLWLPTSASGPVANASVENVGRMHDVHGPWQYQGPVGHYALYNAIDPLLHAEFGVEGAANLAAMRRSNTESLLWPQDETNPLCLHKGAWWIHRSMLESVFGRFDDLEEYVRCSQFLQAEGLRYAIEANRRRKWHCAGTSPWQFNETWPNLNCTNVVDFYGQPRPAYWWCRQAYEPLHPSARYDRLGWSPGETFAAEVWLNNSLAAIPVTLSWTLLDLHGATLANGETDLEAPAAAARQVGTVRWQVTAVPGQAFILRLQAATVDRKVPPNDYLFSTAPEPIFTALRSAPQTTVHARRTCQGIEVSNSGAACALFVRLEPQGDDWLELGRNHFLLLPGETTCVEAFPQDPPLCLTGWNFPPLLL